MTLALLGLVLSGWLIAIAWAAATVDTGRNGFFTQIRVGLNGRMFKLIKIRTMREVAGMGTSVTTKDDPRVTPLGRWLRIFKLDELPQLFNVLVGDMSFVGPRPDVPGFADVLQGDDRIILSVRPGITGPATLKYRDEEELLAAQADPEDYNRRVLFPDKVRINREYVLNYRFSRDLAYMFQTVAGLAAGRGGNRSKSR